MTNRSALTKIDHRGSGADNALPNDPDTTVSRANRTKINTAGVSLLQLYLLRGGYLLVGVGIALTKWPLIITHPRPWPLMEGVETCMLVAMSLLAFLGVRYPLRMLPLLMFELAWKAVWVSVVILPLWRADQLDPATLKIFYSCLVVLIVLAVVPWRYVFVHYVKNQGDRWRPTVTRSIAEDS